MRGGTAAAGPHGASVKVSDASASADAEVGEERVRPRGEQVSPLALLRDCFCPLVITRLASSRDCCDITESFSLMNGDTVVGYRIELIPRLVSCRFILSPLSRGDPFAKSLHRNDAR